MVVGYIKSPKLYFCTVISNIIRPRKVGGSPVKICVPFCSKTYAQNNFMFC